MPAVHDSEHEDCFADMGFMFEGSEASTLKRFEWTKEGQDGSSPKNIRVALSVVDDYPGALQSGHYLWPAAPALAQHLLNETSGPTSIVELGAGCALASLAALQLFAEGSLKCIVATDHDPGTLKRARDNRDSTLEELRDRHGIEFAEKISSIPVLFESLSWGDKNGAKDLLDSLQTTTDTTKAFDLVLGSDLIYCEEVVEPLLMTASFLLDKGESSKFLLSQSFGYDEKTEQAIDKTCKTLRLERTVLLDSLDQNGGVRILKYQWR